MRVALDTSLFSDTGVDPASLLQLILACRRPSPHFTVLTTAWRPSIDDWLRQWPDRVRRVLEEVMRSSVESARRGLALTIVVRPGSSRWREEPTKGPRVSVDDALALVRSPLYVLVENRRNDGRFLARFAITLPDAQRQLFEEAVARGWIAFEHGGGLPEMQHLLDDLDAPADDPVLCPSGARREVRRWRLAVVVDRDSFEAERPESIPKGQWSTPPRDPTQASSESSAIVQRAEVVLHAWAGRSASHQLQRRAIENYLPLRTLGMWIQLAANPQRAGRHKRKVDVRAERVAKVEALKALDAVRSTGLRARWCINMKKGLKGDLPRGLDHDSVADAHVHEIFHSLPSDQRLALYKGFNTREESIADLLFDHEMTPEAWLREELFLDGSTEAPNLILNLLNRM